VDADSPLPTRLDDLIRFVTEQQPHGGALDRLAGAVAVSDRLDEVADHLVGHFVDQARRAGASWTDIGRSMGVSKQAAQQRFVPRAAGPGDAGSAGGGPRSRFTERAWRVVEHAQGHARRAGNDHVGTEHVVLALLDEPDALAARALQAQGLTLPVVAAAATAVLPPAADEVPDHVPFDRASKKLLELTVREALRLDHNYIGTEHLLLALLNDEAGPGAEVLVGLGVDRAEAEMWILDQLATLAQR
jgi:hypothetical protein